jgi:hypothetical protein
LPGRERNDDNAPSPALHFAGSDNRRFGIVAALHDDIGPEKLDQLERSVLGKDDDEVDAFDSREDEGAFRCAANGPAGALEPADRVIAIDADDQRVGGPTRRHEEIDVSRMEQIEYSVGERDPILS